jgi:hypothetical protein
MSNSPNGIGQGYWRPRLCECTSYSRRRKDSLRSNWTLSPQATGRQVSFADTCAPPSSAFRGSRLVESRGNRCLVFCSQCIEPAPAGLTQLSLA